MAESTEPIATRREPVIEALLSLALVCLLVWQMWGSDWREIALCLIATLIVAAYWQLAGRLREVETKLAAVELRNLCTRANGA
jgi:hypothetical protein